MTLPINAPIDIKALAKDLRAGSRADEPQRAELVAPHWKQCGA